MEADSSSKRFYLALGFVLLMTGSVQAIDYSVTNSEVRDDWTDGQIQSNPVVLDIELNESESFQSVDINETGTPFDILTSYNTENQQVEAEITVEQGTQAGNYSVPLELSSNQDTLTDEFNITVLSRYEGDVEFNQETDSMTVGSSGTLGFLQVSNNGNTQLDVDYSFNSTLSPLSEETISVATGDEEETRIIYEIPEDISSGTYNQNLTLESPLFEDGSRTEEITFNLIDENAPQINDIEVNDTQALRTIPININVTDNTGVQSVKADVSRTYREEVQRGNETETVQRTEDVTSFNFTKIEDGLWSYDFSSTDDIGQYEINVTVEDESNNIVTSSQTFNVNRLDVIETPYDIENPNAQRSGLIQTEAFNLTYETEMSLELTKLEYGRSVGATTIELVTPSGDERSFSSLGDTVEFSEPGEYRINFRGNRPGDYRMNFQFQTPDVHVETDTLNIYGEILDINAPQDIRRGWSGAEYIDCETTNLDSGNIEDARYKCVVPFYIDQISSSDDVPVPIMPSAYEQEKSNLNDQITNLKDKVNGSQTGHLLKNILIVFMLGSFGFLTTIYPRLLFFLR